MLSSEELRAKYDAQGKDGLGDHDFVDTGAFFAALFGASEPSHAAAQAAPAAAGLALGPSPGACQLTVRALWRSGCWPCAARRERQIRAVGGAVGAGDHGYGGRGALQSRRFCAAATPRGALKLSPAPASPRCVRSQRCALGGGGGQRLALGEGGGGGGPLHGSVKRRCGMRRAQSRMAVKLADLLSPFVEGDLDSFERQTQALANDLSTASFGSTMLHSIGFMYVNSAEQWLGDPINGAPVAAPAPTPCTESAAPRPPRQPLCALLRRRAAPDGEKGRT